MLRATVWTVGLFGAGTAICRVFPAAWMEPLVLFGLGLALLFVSARTARGTVAPARGRAGVARGAAPARAPKAAGGAVPSAVPAQANS